jgi:hypothetical protein
MQDLNSYQETPAQEQEPGMIRALIDKYGHEKARAYLRTFFAKPENLPYWTILFPNHVKTTSADFHIEILTNLPKGGKQAYAAPRGFAKSTVTDVIGLSWIAIHSHYHFILLISDTYTQAQLHLGALKDELENNKIIKWLYGDIKGKTWGEDTIIVNEDQDAVMIKALGAGMKIRGLRFKQYRPELAVIDDLENLDVVYSPERRKKLQRWFDFDLVPGLAKNKNIIYLGTLLHYHALLKQIVDKKDKYSGWFTRLYKAISGGKSLWPEMYPVEYLIEIRDNPLHPDYVGSIVFAQEFQNEPQDDRDRIIQIGWIQEYSYMATVRSMDADTDTMREAVFRRKLQVYGGVDPAIGQKEQNDNFSFYTMGFDPESGKEYELELIVGKFTIDEQVRKIIECYKRWKHDIIGIESVAYQEGLNQLVKLAAQKEGLYLRTRALKTDTDKIRRARIHSSGFEGKFIYLRSDHSETGKLRTEIEEFPLGDKDDRFDSLMLAREARQQPKVRAFGHKAI